MTIRELRKILTSVDNQELTVKQLRDILFEVEEQDSELTDVGMMELTGDASTYYEYEIEGKKVVRKFLPTTKALAFFHEVSGRISMSDCSDENVTKIVYRGEDFQYMGWLPDEMFNFKGASGETKCFHFPEFEH